MSDGNEIFKSQPEEVPGLALYSKPKQLFGYEQAAKRIANIRLTRISRLWISSEADGEYPLDRQEILW